MIRNMWMSPYVGFCKPMAYQQSTQKLACLMRISKKNVHLKRRPLMYEEEKGYGKPPKKHQFKKGVSGNPKGRPKGKSSLLSDLNKIVNQRISVNLNGQTMLNQAPSLSSKELLMMLLQAEQALDAYYSNYLNLKQSNPIEKACPQASATSKTKPFLSPF